MVCPLVRIKFEQMDKLPKHFTKFQMNRIERQNEYLTKRIQAVKSTIEKFNSRKLHRTSGAIHREKAEQRIRLENNILTRKLKAIYNRR